MVGGHVLRLDEHRSEGVGKDLAGAPQGLGDGAPDEPSLEARWDVRVDPVDALPLVVLQVIAPERHTIGNPHRPIRNHGEEPVMSRAFEEEVVRELVNSEEEGLTTQFGPPILRSFGELVLGCIDSYGS